MARPRIIGLLLALITLVVYLPAGRHDFIVFDDPEYVTENRIVQQGITLNGVSWAFTSFHASNWHPVTWLSHMLDCGLFGLNPGAQHIVNALIHAINAVLVLVLLLQLTGRLWPAAIVAALFAWHPLRVESVAWISERKDVLSMFFGLLCLLAYTKHAKESRTSELRPQTPAYWLALLFFALGLMAKPMLVTLPSVMLLLDWWLLKGVTRDEWQVTGSTWRRLVLEKTPFFLLVVVSCVLTVLAQRTEAVVALEHVPLDLRLKNAAVACGSYLLKTIWPMHLAVLYPLPRQIELVKVVAALVVIAGLTVVAWHWRKAKPHLLVGWLWFIGTLVPVIGIVQVGGQAMADRYTYLPHIGLFIAIVYELAVWSPGFSRKGERKSKIAGPAKAGTPTGRALAVVAGAIALACLVATIRQLSYWKDSETLFAHTLAVTRDNPIAHINLGVALEQQGRIADARTQYEAAAKLDPNRVQAQVNLANMLDATGETERALEHYRMALQLNRNSPLVHLNFGSALVKLGRFDEAKQHYDEAKRLAPNDPRAFYLMGKSLLRQGRSQEAVVEFKEALRIDPNHLQTLVWFARTRAVDFDPQVRQGSDAVKLAKQAVEMTGEGDPFILDTLAAALAESGRFVEAEQTLQRALQLLSDAGDTNTTALTTRLQLYRLKQPYRESFTNAVETSGQ
ncbi:MAG TPA: tetratricopeptide repeat protein [Verrucomicrobiae bacterium]|nr:tetratricopeptide repeat protein [Verrucomicrobiae bacterium]